MIDQIKIQSLHRCSFGKCILKHQFTLHLGDKITNKSPALAQFLILAC